MRPQEPGELRMTTPGMRRMLLVASGLVFLVGIQLYVFTQYTGRYFAWTITSSLTAAFLGASYWASCAIELLGSRQRTWAHARIAVPAVLIFTTLTLIVTLVHWDRFHFDHPDSMARIAAWAWLVVYGVVPPILAALLLVQIRRPGADPPRQPLPSWGRAVLLVHGVVLMPIGTALLIAPQFSLDYWPWSLTPLTARAVGAWLLSLGIAAVHARWENDWQRVRIAAVAYTVFAILQIVALLRYPDEMQWSRPGAWLYLVFIASTLALGVVGWWKVGRITGGWPRPAHR